MIFFSLTEAPLPDPTTTPPNTLKRTRNSATLQTHIPSIKGVEVHPLSKGVDFPKPLVLECLLSPTLNLVIFFSLTEAPLPDSTPTQHPETDPKRSRNGAKRSQKDPKRTETEPKWTEIELSGVGTAGGVCRSGGRWGL